MDQPRRDIPLPLAIGVLAALLAAGGWAIWKYVYKSPNAIRAITPSPGAPRVASKNPPKVPAEILAIDREAELADGLYVKDGRALFKAGDAYLKCTVKGEEPRFGFYSVTESEWEHGYLSLGVRRIVADDAFVKELGLTKEQVDQLDNLPPAPSAKWADADRGRLTKLLDEWDRLPESDKVAKGKVIHQELSDYASARRSNSDQQIAQRVKIIKSTLTPAQIARINPIPRWDLSSTRPSTNPATPQ